MSVKIKCSYCGQTKEVKSAKAKFCSDECRNKSFRQGPAITAPVEEDGSGHPAIVEADRERAFRSEPVCLMEGEPVNVFHSSKPLTTGENTIPVSDTQNWKRPNYWLRLRDLEPEEALAFHAWIKSTKRACPTDPTLPTGEQDFFHPWAYTEFKNPPLDNQLPKGKTRELFQIPPGLPLNDGSAECMHERMKRVKSYNETMPPKHCLSESKLKALLTRAGYSPSLAKLAFPKS